MADLCIEDIKVGIAEWKVALSPYRLVTLGLGSCVGIALYDRSSKIGGLAHIMLPDSKFFSGYNNPGKFPDLAIPSVFQEMVRQGARSSLILARIAGGAQMFSFSNKPPTLMNIGERNVETTKKVLHQLGIRLVAEDTGGSHGRTMVLDIRSGEICIKAAGRPYLTM